MDRLAPDLHIVWQMFALLVCVCMTVTVCACVHARVPAHPDVGIQVLQAPGAITDLSLLMLFISSRLFASGRSALQSNIPHTPLELRERPVARQGRSSGMSLLSQGERMEGGREWEVRLEGPTVVRLTLVRTAGAVGVSIIKALIAAVSSAHGLILPQRSMPVAQSEHIGV